MRFKDAYLEVWRSFYSPQPNHLCNFSRRHYVEHFYEIILNLNQWFRGEMLFKDVSNLVALLLSRAELFLQVWTRAL